MFLISFIKSNKVRALLVVSFSMIVSSIGFAAERYSGFFEEIESDREQAVQSAVMSVTRDALGNLVRDENWNPNILACMEQWISDDLSPRYRNLVSNLLFDLDQAIGSQWAVEGSMRIEMGFLDRWLQEQLTDPECGPGLQQRRTVYLQPVTILDEEANAIADAALRHIEQILSRNGYQIVEEARRQYAQFRLGIENVEMMSRGPVKTLNVSGFYVDNRIEGQPFLAINASVDERVRTTEAALDNDLYERQSASVLAQIREWEATHIVENEEVELIFVSRQSTYDSAEVLLEELITSFDFPPEFSDQPEVLQITNLDDGLIEVSILIPAEYGFSLSRTIMRQIQTLAGEILGYEVAASVFSNNATRLSIFDANTIQAEWEKLFWEYLDAGKLVYPESENAYAVIRSRLITVPGDETALGYLDEVVSRLVQRAVLKISQNALTSAGADLTLAESIGSAREDKPWEFARRELDAAIARQQAAANSIILVENSNGSSAGSVPLIVFPALENVLTRAISIAPSRGILGLAADTEGIKSVEVNGQIVNFSRASAQNQRFLTVPGAYAEEFYIPLNLSEGLSELEVVVTDGRDESSTRFLKREGERFVVASSTANGTVANSELLKEGDAVLAGKYHALIIANEDYDRVSDLATPVNDAEALRDVLISSYSFESENIYMLMNGTKAEIELEIDRLQEKVNPNDSVLIYYAGHGYQDLGLDGTGYWIPKDGLNSDARDHRTTWVSNTYVADYVEKLHARHVLLISDSCYAGTFAQRSSDSDYFMMSSEFFQQKAGQTSRRAITSGDIEPVLDGGGDGHSIFAHHMLSVLRESAGNYLTGEYLFQQIINPVQDNAPQTPQYFVMSDNDAGGDFVFVPGNL